MPTPNRRRMIPPLSQMDRSGTRETPRTNLPGLTLPDSTQRRRRIRLLFWFRNKLSFSALCAETEGYACSVVRHSDFFADEPCQGELVPVEYADRMYHLPRRCQVLWCSQCGTEFPLPARLEMADTHLSRLRRQAMNRFVQHGPARK